MTVRASGDGYDFPPSGSATNSIATVIEADIAPTAPRAVGTGTGLKADVLEQHHVLRLPGGRPDRPDRQLRLALQRLPAGRDHHRQLLRALDRHDRAATTRARYTFTTASDDTVQVWIDGQLVIDNATPHTAAVDQGSVTLVAGRRHEIRVDYTDRPGEAFMKLAWASPNTPAQIVPQTSSTPRAPRSAGSTATRPRTAPAGPPAAAGASATSTTTCTTPPPTARRSPTPSPEPASTSCRRSTPTRGSWTSTSTASCGPPSTRPATYPPGRPGHLGRPELSQGTHTLRGVKRSGQYMLVDAFDVFS